MSIRPGPRKHTRRPSRTRCLLLQLNLANHDIVLGLEDGAARPRADHLGHLCEGVADGCQEGRHDAEREHGAHTIVEVEAEGDAQRDGQQHGEEDGVQQREGVEDVAVPQTRASHAEKQKC